MPKISEHRDALNDDRRQIDRARKEAEALFRPKPKLVEISMLADTLLQPDTLPRKPRILSALGPPLNHRSAKVLVSSGPQVGVPGSQAHTDRERLDQARAAILEKQHQLRTNLDAINTELRAIDAYEAVRRGKTGRTVSG